MSIHSLHEPHPIRVLPAATLLTLLLAGCAGSDSPPLVGSPDADAIPVGPGGDAPIPGDPAADDPAGDPAIDPTATFRVLGDQLVDPTGEPVILRGVNRMNIYLDHDGAASFPEIRRTEANTVRIVWATAVDDFVPTANDLDVVISNAIANDLIPMVELHDATGHWAGLGRLVEYWKRPDILAVIRKHERVLLVNIGNEVGDDAVTTEMFRAAYTDAVVTLREAGIRTPLVIDAPDWGKNLDILIATHAALTGADPDHNLLFSVHLYWPKHGGADAAFLRAKLQAAADAQVPLIVGEFASHGAYAGGESMCGPRGEVDWETILEECHRHGFGWYAWEWGPGNVGGGDPLCTVMDMTVDGRFDTLQPGWAREVAIESPYGIRATSITPRSMLD